MTDGANDRLMAAPIDRALSWARDRHQRRRYRRLVRAGLALTSLAVLGIALFSSWETLGLVATGLAGIAATAIGSFVLSRVHRPGPTRLAQLADRAFGLEDRLVTALDPASRGRFRDTLREEVGRRVEREADGPTRRSGGRRRGRLARWWRRWRAHLFIVLFILLVLGFHGLFGPGLRPRPARDGVGPRSESALGNIAKMELTVAGKSGAPFRKGQPIPARLSLDAAEPDTAVERLSVRTGQGDVVDVPGRLSGGGSLSLDLGRVLSAAGRAGGGTCRIEVVGRATDGRPARSNRVSITISDPGGGAGQGGGSAPDPKPKSSPPQPAGQKEKPDPKSRLPGLGPEERTPVRETPVPVVPLIDESGRVINAERRTLEHGGGEKAPRPEAAAGQHAVRRDLVEAYRRQAERAMERRAVPPLLREVYRRYLEALTR